MNERLINLLTTLGAVLIGTIALTWWLLHNPVKNFVENIPGMDNRPEVLSSDRPTVDIGGVFASFDGIASNIPGSWPRFRGADIDNISKERIRLADRWSAEGPPVLWSIELGEGHAGPVIANGRVYLLDYDEEARSDILRCFSFEDGREIWRRGYEVFIKRNHGMSRTVPTVSGNYVVTMGPKCHVMCVDASTGDFIWGMDLVKDFGAEEPLWYTGQCPFIDGTTVVIAVGGKSLLMGINIETGEVIWETPNPQLWKMSHSSVISMTVSGRPVYVYGAIGGIVGVSAEEGSQGEVLFESGEWGPNVMAPSPVPIGDGRILATAGYGYGSMMLDLKREGETFAVEVLQLVKPEEGLASEQQTPVFYKGHLFTILPKDAGPKRNEFVCYHPDDICRIVWTSGKINRFGLGPYIVADDKFFILSDEGVLTVLKASTAEYIQLAQVKILDGVDAWGPLAIVQGRLLARDSRRLVCIDMRAGN